MSLDRLSRLRRSPALRDLVRETQLHPSDFVLPLFVAETDELAGPIASMPGQKRWTTNELPGLAVRLGEVGVRGVLLFGVPTRKDERGSSAWDESGVVPEAVARLKEARTGLVVMTDVCLCGYTDHGHCGPRRRNGEIDRDPTLDGYARMARAHAASGADVVAPSGMIDGMVRSIREELDASGNDGTAILSYAAKFASSFYGPFRDAADSAPSGGDRRDHQLDPANGLEAVEEARQDVAEGADLLMVKPALPYLDILSAITEEIPGVPCAAYQVSGEYAMIQAAARAGAIHERDVAMESLQSIKRAGARFILTYFAEEAARWCTP